MECAGPDREADGRTPAWQPGAHILSYDPVSRALFARTAEPVQGPTQVGLIARLDRLFQYSGPDQFYYAWRFYVEGPLYDAGSLRSDAGLTRPCQSLGR
jgi:hypothetical protein